MKENLRYILTLVTICLVMASVLTGIYLLTNPKIIAQRVKAEEEALKQVMPQANFFQPIRRDGKTEYFQAYTNKEKTQLLGYAFIARGQGYAGVIETMAGMDTEGRITGIKVLSQNETPGLGARIDEVVVEKTLWQKIKEVIGIEKKDKETKAEPWFCVRFKGKKIATEEVQAITGATISSKALTDSVRQRAQEILEDAK